uniref:Uncharacterized protein n=1 Tax=Arundo donax TaxID=35708 RepID=A0A0A9A1E1_ARUDO
MNFFTEKKAKNINPSNSSDRE